MMLALNLVWGPRAGIMILQASIKGRRASVGSKSSKNEGLGFCKPLLRCVVASGGSQSSKIEGLGFVKLLRGVVASSGSE